MLNTSDIKNRKGKQSQSQRHREKAVIFDKGKYLITGFTECSFCIFSHLLSFIILCAQKHKMSQKEEPLRIYSFAFNVMLIDKSFFLPQNAKIPS